MGTKIKLLAFAMACASILISTSQIKAQSFNGPLLGANRYELQTQPSNPFSVFVALL